MLDGMKTAMKMIWSWIYLRSIQCAIRKPLKKRTCRQSPFTKFMLLALFFKSESESTICSDLGRLGSLEFRAQPDWAYEFPDRTGPDTQICQTGPAGPDWIRTYISKHLSYQLQVITSHTHKIRFLNTNLVSKNPRPNKSHLAWADFRIKVKWIAHSIVHFDQ